MEGVDGPVSGTDGRTAVEQPTLPRDLERFIALDAAEIDAMPWQQLPGRAGVARKVLFSHGDIWVALLYYGAGTSSVGESHYAAHHHIWVVAGAATIAGRRFTAGSYLHVPPGVPHPTTDVGVEGCTLLYMHRSSDPGG